MVGHQHVGVELTVVSLSVMLQSLQIDRAVFVVQEDVLALVASGDDMVEGAFELNPWLACHRENLCECLKISQ